MTEEELERYTEIAERYSRTWPQGKAAIDLLIAEVRRLEAENARIRGAYERMAEDEVLRGLADGGE